MAILLISLWASVAFTIYWIDFARIPQRIPLFNHKPFNCEMCLPVWAFAAFYTLAIYRCDVIVFIAAAFTAGIVTPLILKWINK